MKKSKILINNYYELLTGVETMKIYMSFLHPLTLYC